MPSATLSWLKVMPTVYWLLEKHLCFFIWITPEHTGIFLELPLSFIFLTVAKNWKFCSPFGNKFKASEVGLCCTKLCKSWKFLTFFHPIFLWRSLGHIRVDNGVYLWGQYMDLPPPVMRPGQGASGQKDCVLFWEWIVTPSLSPFGSGFLSRDCFWTFSFCTYTLM